MKYRSLTTAALTLLLLTPPARAVSDARSKPRKGPVRVLLFAGAPNRDYQFLRRVLFRKVKARRLEVGVFLQDGSGEEFIPKGNQPREWVLNHFPNRVMADGPKERPYVLSGYDVLIAFDPDWTGLKDAEIKLLAEWVKNQTGGLVLVAGPVHTPALTRPRKKPNLAPVAGLYPVTLADPAKLKPARAVRPRPLYFAEDTRGLDFLKLKDKGKGNLAGWEGFFFGPPRKGEGKPAVALRGFYSAYPVKKARPDAKVVATRGPKGSPYLVTWTHGSGRVVFLGSAETWRLRKYRAAYHQRFWLGLIAHAAGRPLK
jgi:hypothetical protein